MRVNLAILHLKLIDSIAYVHQFAKSSITLE